ncbi:hypothetical protein Vadar_014984 [Vaccinium darrowii]|uniref:Uncharacterized protein n=1 Tax=Vaccinium darrowii TaxID=229202 RepID=A0ACB7YN05_9ERIC|nr:hypothetical protein Vadar_014984 [Vaccinium darrowii]
MKEASKKKMYPCLKEASKKKMYPCRNRKSMMARLQFGLKYSGFLMTLATSATGINLKLSTSPSAERNNQVKKRNFAANNSIENGNKHLTVEMPIPIDDAIKD